MPQVLPTAGINFTHDGLRTRITEWKQFPEHAAPHGSADVTTLAYEEPCRAEDNAMERYHPVKDLHGANRKTYRRHHEQVTPTMAFIGRCGQYVYLDMLQAVSVVLARGASTLARVRLNGLKRPAASALPPGRQVPPPWSRPPAPR